MIFLKKFTLGFAALALILFGGAGTQSPSLLFQGVGFIGLIIGLIVLYIFTKMAWRAMGCLPSFLAVGGILAFILYAIGGFNNGIGGLGQTLRSFLGNQPSEKHSSQGPVLIDEQEEINISENFSPQLHEGTGRSRQTVPQQAAPQANNSSSGLGSFFKKREPEQFNPTNLPLVRSQAKVLRGDVLQLQGVKFKLFGIDAPDTSQTCADNQGRSYNCGVKSVNWLKSWITDNELDCRVMQRDEAGNMVGLCFLGQYDIGAALVNAGWAVAYPKQTDIYVPYQDQARANSYGLWQGKFYMPWDWRTLQSKKANIKIIKPKVKKKNILDVGYGRE